MCVKSGSWWFDLISYLSREWRSSSFRRNWRSTALLSDSIPTIFRVVRSIKSGHVNTVSIFTVKSLRLLIDIWSPFIVWRSLSLSVSYLLISPRRWRSIVSWVKFPTQRLSTFICPASIAYLIRLNGPA